MQRELQEPSGPHEPSTAPAQGGSAHLGDAQKWVHSAYAPCGPLAAATASSRALQFSRARCSARAWTCQRSATCARDPTSSTRQPTRRRTSSAATTAAAQVRTRALTFHAAASSCSAPFVRRLHREYARINATARLAVHRVQEVSGARWRESIDRTSQRFSCSYCGSSADDDQLLFCDGERRRVARPHTPERRVCRLRSRLPLLLPQAAAQEGARGQLELLLVPARVCAARLASAAAASAMSVKSAQRSRQRPAR